MYLENCMSGLVFGNVYLRFLMFMSGYLYDFWFLNLMYYFMVKDVGILLNIFVLWWDMYFNYNLWYLEIFGFIFGIYFFLFFNYFNIDYSLIYLLGFFSNLYLVSN